MGLIGIVGGGVLANKALGAGPIGTLAGAVFGHIAETTAVAAVYTIAQQAAQDTRALPPPPPGTTRTIRTVRRVPVWGLGGDGKDHPITMYDFGRGPRTGRVKIGRVRLGALSVEDQAAADRIYSAYSGYTHMTPPLAARIVEVARKINASPYDLANVIRHESQFSPRAQNKPGPVAERNARGDERYSFNPKGGATGLLQFIPPTLASYGRSMREAWDMPSTEQMALVEQYLSDRLRGLNRTASKNDLYMSVFYPAYIGKPATTVFPANVQENNPGIKTVSDYVRAADKYARLTSDGMLRATFTRGKYLAHPDERPALVAAKAVAPTAPAAAAPTQVAQQVKTNGFPLAAGVAGATVFGALAVAGFARGTR